MQNQISQNVAQIIEKLSGIPDLFPAGGSDGVWTAAIKKAVIELGKAKGYLLCASGFPDEAETEWLYDLVWFKNDENAHLQEIGLLLECEWIRDPYQIEYDFSKLLVGRAPIKVMIFQDYNGNLADLWKMLDDALTAFNAPAENETYILAAYCNDTGKFEIRTRSR